MKCITVSLDDVCDIVIGRTPSRANPALWGVGEPWASISDMNQGRTLTRTKEQITAEGAERGRKIAPGTVLLSFKLSIGKVARAGLPLYTNEAIAALPIRDESILDPEYLMRALEAADLASGSNRAAMGETLNKASLKKVVLLLPPIAKQREIASSLNNIDATLQKVRSIRSLYQSLRLSVFTEIFGSVLQSRWDYVPLEQLLCYIETGSSPRCESRPARHPEWAVLKLGAVTYGEFRPEENKAYLGNVDTLRKNEVKPGDVLMTRKNTLDLVGAVAIAHEAPEKLLLPDLVFRLSLDAERINSTYFQALMMHPAKRPIVRGLARGSAASMSNISIGRLKELKIELPPKQLQDDYARKAKEIEFQEAAIERGAELVAELFASVQSRAFRGEL